jgi:glucose-1-phosphate thymidylyltransferase
MKIIVPMGTWFPPSPTYFNYSKTIIPIAGKPIVHRLVEDIAKILDEPIDEIAFTRILLFFR